MNEHWGHIDLVLGIPGGPRCFNCVPRASLVTLAWPTAKTKARTDVRSLLVEMSLVFVFFVDMATGFLNES